MLNTPSLSVRSLNPTSLGFLLASLSFRCVKVFERESASEQRISERYGSICMIPGTVRIICTYKTEHSEVLSHDLSRSRIPKLARKQIIIIMVINKNNQRIFRPQRKRALFFFRLGRKASDDLTVGRKIIRPKPQPNYFCEFHDIATGT